jgi:FK506-binding protein 2
MLINTLLSLFAVSAAAADDKLWTVDQLQIGITKRIAAEDCTRKSQPGDQLSMHYTGTLTNGKQFDSSIGRGPFEFELGAGRVIRGWDQGLVGMCVGEKRKLKIPSHMGYGTLFLSR